ncbi:MAG: MBL fold metallo-hydrolase [Proteobacteria bacterium]|nr:MBL fold metallo-hydrolase [Pseudomonadota bacterium]
MEPCLVDLTFLGGAGTVTGSKYLLERDGVRILVDCGLFQGLKVHRLKNWAQLPVAPASLSAVVLTHAHIDHSGALPLLVREGYRGPIFCTGATRDLCGILLPDAAHLQEKDADFANRHGFSRHKPALPLYTQADAARALEQLRTVAFGETLELPGGAAARFRRAGHILGAAMIDIAWGGTRIQFSGDLGRMGDPMMLDPEPPSDADYLIVESTYGDRLHSPLDAGAALGAVIDRVEKRGGTVIVPAFAVGRAQLMLYHLHRLRESGRLSKKLPIYVDSPMATDATTIFRAHPDDHRLAPSACADIFRIAHYVRDGEESRAVTADPSPKIVISASGMASGGRVLHHLKRYAPDANSAIVFTGFQSEGTRGAAMVRGTDMIKIHGSYYPVRAEIANLDMLSAHADRAELMGWLKRAPRAPKQVFVTHGEPLAADTLRRKIVEELGWTATAPEMRDCVRLDG